MKIANISFYFIDTCSKYISNMHVKYFYLQIDFFILVYFNLRINLIRLLIDYKYIL